MNGKARGLTIAGAVVGLVLGGFQINAQVRAYIDHKMAEEAARLKAIERLNELEARVCELEGGRWWQGECLNDPLSQRAVMGPP